ncbi:MAG: GDP-mannose 4,6-dehydratase [Phycisphaerae bacterium]
MSRIAVTGGAGFIGSHLCDALLGAGHEVVALDNFDDFYDPHTKRRNLTSAFACDRFTLVEGDIRDEAAVAEVVDSGVLAVVHLAARAGVRPSIEQPLLYQDVNVRGTLTVLEACRRLPNCRFIFASSSSVYGNRPDVPFRESDPVDDPISPYAATKKAGELLCHTYHHLFGINVTCLRLFTVYGPRQRPDLAIHKFARLIEQGESVPVYGDGSTCRDYTYINDTIHGLTRAIERCAGYHMYNLGTSHPVTLVDLAATLEDVLGRKAVIDHRPRQPGDVERTCADISLARRELDYQPTTDLREGLARFVEWLRSEHLRKA